MNTDQIKNATTEDLLTWHMNAFATYQEAGGHTKAYWNEVRYKAYAEELDKRKVQYDKRPTGKGTFNGPGAT